MYNIKTSRPSSSHSNRSRSQSYTADVRRSVVLPTPPISPNQSRPSSSTSREHTLLIQSPFVGDVQEMASGNDFSHFERPMRSVRSMRSMATSVTDLDVSLEHDSHIESRSIGTSMSDFLEAFQYEDQSKSQNELSALIERDSPRIDCKSVATSMSDTIGKKIKQNQNEDSLEAYKAMQSSNTKLQEQVSQLLLENDSLNKELQNLDQINHMYAAQQTHFQQAQRIIEERQRNVQFIEENERVSTHAVSWSCFFFLS